jgi:hypothetical protein
MLACCAIAVFIISQIYLAVNGMRNAVFGGAKSPERIDNAASWRLCAGEESATWIMESPYANENNSVDRSMRGLNLRVQNFVAKMFKFSSLRVAVAGGISIAAAFTLILTISVVAQKDVSINDFFNDPANFCGVIWSRSQRDD